MEEELTQEIITNVNNVPWDLDTLSEEILTWNSWSNMWFIDKALSSPEDFFSGLTITYIVVWCVVFFWFITVVWVAKDAASRSRGIRWQIWSIMLVTLLTPLFGLPLYLALRPSEFKLNTLARREALDIQTTRCKKCKTVNLYTFVHCVYCSNTLAHECKQCKNTYPDDFPYCNSCGAPNNFCKQK